MLTEKLSVFESSVPQNLSEKEIQNVEEVLIGLMKINKGDLSMQFSSRLAECFIYLYKMPKSPKIFNFVSSVSQNPTQCAFFTAGFVLIALGANSKSLVPTLIDSIFKNYKRIEDSALFALNYCFKACGKESNELVKFAKKAFSFATSFLVLEKKTQTHLLAIKLLKRISHFTSEIPAEKQIKQMKGVLNEASFSLLVQKKAAELISTILLRETASNKEKLVASLQEIKKIKNNKEVLSHFINFMNNELLQQNAETVLTFLRETNPDFVKVFVKLLSIETKKALFDIVEKETAKAKQLDVLQHLVYDDESLRMTSALAMQIMTSKPSERERAITFYKTLPQKSRTLAEEVVRSCSLFLAYPPDKHPKLGRHMVGMSMIVSLLLLSEKSLLTSDIKELLSQFEKSVFSTGNILKGSYTGAFLVAKAAILCDEQLIRNSLKHIIHFFQTKTESYSSKEGLLLSAVAAFFTSHGSKKYIPLLVEVLSTNQNQTALARMIGTTSHYPMTPTMFKFLNTFCMSVKPPSRNYNLLRLSHFMIPENCLFEPLLVEHNQTKVSLEINEEEISTIVCDNYADFVQRAPEECRDLSCLLKPNVNLHLLLSIAQNPKTVSMLPQNGYLNALYDVLTKTNVSTGIADVQAACEILSAYARNESNFKDITKRMKKLEPSKRALLIGALLSGSNPSESFVLESINELNDIAKTDNCKYAMHALICLFQDCTAAALSLHIAAVESRFLLTILHSPLMLDPTNFLMTANAFTAILPIISAEGDHELNDVVSDIFQCFSGTRIPFALQTFSRVVSQVLAFSRTSVSLSRLRFPSERACGMAVSTTSGAYADFINSNAESLNDDFFEFIGRVLFTLQTVAVSRCAEFVSASSSVSNKVNEWVNLYKECLAKSTLPSTTIEAVPNVKYALLLAMKNTLKKIVGEEKLNTAALDDIITALTRTVSSCDKQNVLREAFSRFAEVVQLFKNIKSDETGQCTLDLYDSQFSIAVRNALKEILISETFLNAYLDFLVKDNNQLSHAVECYTSCLTETEKNPSAITLIAKLINYVIGDKENEAKIGKLCDSSASAFAAVIDKAIDVFTNNDWKEVSKFRTYYMESFSDIISAIIWIQSRSEKVFITTKRLMTFFTSDLQRTQEVWRVNAEISGIISCFKLLKEVPDIHRYQALTSVPKNHKLTPDFIICFAEKLVQDDPQIKNFVDYIDGVKDVPIKAYAEVIYHAYESFIDEKYQYLFDKVKNSPVVCSLLFQRVKKTSYEFFINQILETAENGLELAHRLIAATNTVDSRIADFVLSDFERKGFEVIGSLLSSKKTEECGIKLLERFTEETGKEVENEERFANFLLLSIQYANRQTLDKFTLYAIKKASQLAVKEAPAVSQPSIAVLAYVRKTAEPLLRSVLKGNCKELVECLEKKQEKEKTKKVVLKSFGSGSLRRQAANDGEWQSLDDSD